MILINPNYNRAQKLGGFSRYVPLSVPIGIGYLASALINDGKSAKILDEEAVGMADTLLDEYTKGMEYPFIFGLSCLTANIKRAHELACIIKKKYPKSVIMFGGMHANILSGEILNDSNVDIVVHSEAEEIIVKLYDCIKNNKDYSGIDGISFRQNGKVVHNKNASLPDLKKVPRFPYYLFKQHSNRYNLGFIASSRGCPYNCIFCSQRIISGNKYRFLPADVVMGYIEELVDKYNEDFITFLDDAFLINKARVVQLCEMIKVKGFHKKVSFDCQARGDSINEEILKILMESGFRTIDFGIETASERLMKLIDKKETVERIKEGIRLAKKFGFVVCGTFILGLPTETKEERRAAYDLAKELSLDYVRFNNATPYPGTKLYEIAKKENRLCKGDNWENLNTCGSFVEPPFKKNFLSYVPLTASEEELRHDILKYNMFYSFRLESLYKIFKEKVGPAGWLELPEKWYLDPEEWLYLIKFGFSVMFSFLKIFLYDFLSIFRKS